LRSMYKDPKLVFYTNSLRLLAIVTKPLQICIVVNNNIVFWVKYAQIIELYELFE